MIRRLVFRISVFKECHYSSDTKCHYLEDSKKCCHSIEKPPGSNFLNNGSLFQGQTEVVTLQNSDKTSKYQNSAESWGCVGTIHPLNSFISLKWMKLDILFKFCFSSSYWMLILFPGFNFVTARSKISEISMFGWLPECEISTKFVGQCVNQESQCQNSNGNQLGFQVVNWQHDRCKEGPKMLLYINN